MMGVVTISFAPQLPRSPIKGCAERWPPGFPDMLCADHRRSEQTIFQLDRLRAAFNLGGDDTSDQD